MTPRLSSVFVALSFLALAGCGASSSPSTSTTTPIEVDSAGLDATEMNTQLLGTGEDKVNTPALDMAKTMSGARINTSTSTGSALR